MTTFDLDDYLRLLAGEGDRGELLELRFRAGDRFLSSFARLDDLRPLAREIDARSPSTDVYVGCAPRRRRSGRRAAVGRLWVLWAECDRRDASVAAALHRPRPTLIVASGTGANVHAYWALRDPVEPAVAESANLRLARAFGADEGCFDAGRILRPPGSWNHRHEPPRPVTVLGVDERRRCEVEEVVAATPELETARVERRRAGRPRGGAGEDPLLCISPRSYVPGLLGGRSVRGPKHHCPFHADERPSLHAYTEPERGWFCFSCRRGGSVYDLASELWGVRARGAEFVRLRRRLREQFIECQPGIGR